MNAKPSRSARLCAMALSVLFTRDGLSSQAKNRIVFTRAGPSSMGLFLSDIDGRNERALLPPTGLDYNASFTRDGTWIVFTSERDGSADLFRIHPDGSALERLTDSPSYDDQGALSPDGKTLAFVSSRDGGRANVWLLDLARHSYRNLTKAGSGNFRPSWSPDGQWLAFTSDREEPHRRREPSWELLHFTAIYVIRRDGGALRRLTPLGEFAHRPEWSADGRRILYSSRLNVQDKPLAFSVEVATGVRSAQGAENAGIGDGIAVSPDGRTKVYGKWIKPPVDPAIAITPVFSIDKGFELFRSGTFPAYAPDGVHLLVAGGFGNSSNTLTLLDFVGTPARTLFEGAKGSWAVAPSWSPDGRTIAFSMGSFFDRPPKPGQIALIDGTGAGLRTLTQGETSSGFPSFSPDGKRLVFRVLGKDEQGLRILSLEDGTITTLTTGWDNFPAWSPRGDRIVFSALRAGDFEICTIRPDGTDFRQLTRDHGNDAHPNWSPDGQSIVFTSSRMGWKDEGYGSDQSYGEIFMMRADGRQLHQLTDNQWEDATATWLPARPRLLKHTPD